MVVESFCLRRLFAGLASVGTVLLALPAIAVGDFGTPTTEDSTINNTFGWSAKRQVSGGTPAPIILQYRKGVAADGSCNQSDGPDEPLHAIRFRNANGQMRTQITFPQGVRNRRMIGLDLHDARRESSPSIQSDTRYSPTEFRQCFLDVIFHGQHYGSGLGPADPRDYDDVEWISSPYYVPDMNGDGQTDADGGRVFAHMHQEARPTFASNPSSYCTYPDFEALCWVAAVTSAESSPNLADCSTDGSGSNATTPNIVGGCYTHNRLQANPFTFPPTDLRHHIVAAIPYQYWLNWGCDPNDPNEAPIYQGELCGRHGYKESTHVIKGEPGIGASDMAGKHFIMSQVSAPFFDSDGQPLNSPQKRGHCLLQTSNIRNPDDWLAWNGQSFSVDLRTGYNLDGDSPANHVCEPVTGGLDFQIWSLTYNRYLKKYMLMGQRADRVDYLLSDDLRNWGPTQVLMEAPPRGRAVSKCKDGITYAHLIDPDDPAKNWTIPSDGDPNYIHPGPTPDIYANYMEVHPPPLGSSSCVRQEGDPLKEVGGNVARIPIDLRNQRQATLEGSLTDGTWGFDAIHDPSHSILFQDSTAANPGYGERDLTTAPSQKYVQATVWGGAGNSSKRPHGIVNVNWGNGDEVWYGSAFYLPSNFHTANGNTDILAWHSATGLDFGGVRLQSSDRRFHVVRGRRVGDVTTNVTDIGERSFDLPRDRWFWLEVHQKLTDVASDDVTTEVLVDGTLVSSSNSPNRLSAEKVSELDVGFVTSDPLWNPFSWMFIDRISILGAPRGAVKGPNSNQAPDTPTGLRVTTGETSANATVNGFPAGQNVTGYRLQYRVNGIWSSTVESTSPSFLVPGLECGTTYQFRSTAFRRDPSGNVRESIVSTPVTASTQPCS